MFKRLGQKKYIRRAIIWLLLLLGIYLLLQLSPVLTRPETMLADDYVQYWAGGKLLLDGDNPYDPALVNDIKYEIIRLSPGDEPISIVLAPPWALPIFLPLSLLDYSISRLVWLLISAFIILLTSLSFWRLLSGIHHLRWIAFLVVFIFAPTISVLSKGQISVLILLGICGILYFIVIDQNDWLVGVSIAFVTIKPQIAFLFCVAIFLWIIHQRRWKIMLSAVASILVLSLIAVVFNPKIVQQYWLMLQTYQISGWANPTLGAYLRFFWLGLDKFWVQFLPALIAGLILIIYWFIRRNSWDWLEELPLLLFFSQIASPYTWTYDQVILLPAVIQVSIWIVRDWKRWATLLLAIVFLGINALDLILHRSMNEFWFIWLAPAYLLWYILVYWQFQISRKGQTNPVPIAG